MHMWRYALLVFLGGCCYGALSTVVKLAYAAGFSSGEVVGFQYSIGAFLCGVVYILFSRKRQLGWRLSFKLIVLGTPFALTGIFYYRSLNTLGASLAIIFLFQFVWVGTLLDWLINGNKPGRRRLFSIGMLLVGSILATGAFSGAAARFSVEGAFWGMLSAVSFAFFIFINSAVGRDIPPVQKSLLFCIGACVTVWLLLRPVTLFDPGTALRLAPYGVFLGFVGVVLPPILFAIGMPHVGPGLGTTLSASELPVAVTLSSLVLAEQVHPLQWCGVATILAGILVANIVPRKRDAQLND